MSEFTTAPSPWDLLSIPRSESYVKIVGAYVLLPLRLLSLAILLLGAFVCVSIVSIGNSTTTPIPKARSDAIRIISRIFGRAMLFVSGFYYIEEVYMNCEKDTMKKQRENGELPKLIVCNHSSYLDILIMVAMSCPSFVSKADVAKAPIGTVYGLLFTMYTSSLCL
jgi:1-acyl-sn-glycerol-3-phosphate acyltransferase